MQLHRSSVMAPMGRIHTRSSFRALARPEGRATRGLVTVAYVSPANPERSRPAVAYAIGRRHGNAVHRNRLRRRLREAMASAAQELPAGEYLVRARPEAETAPFSDLCRAIATAAMGAASQVSRPDDQWGG